MDPKHFLTTMTLSLLTFTTAISAQGSVREGGGVLNLRVHYQCLETNPKNPSSPVFATVSEFNGQIRLVLNSMNRSGQAPIYASNVQVNRQIRCVVACDMYESPKDQVLFAVTNLGKSSTAAFSSPRGNLNFTCEQGANR